jgi:DNA invertase Pin-like site-specific DNA recombinase
MKLVAYARVSVSNGSDSLEAQLEEIRAWAAREGYEIVGEFTDDGISGVKGEDERNGLAAAITAIVDDEADAICAHRADRYARALHVQEAVYAAVWRSGGRLFEVVGGEILEDDPDDPYRTAMRQMAGVFSQLERGMVRARMQRGRRRARAAGRHIGGSAPYGFQVAESGNLLPIAEEQEHIRLIVKLRQTGATFRAIAEQLEQSGAGKWSAMKVRRVWERAKP